MLQDCCLAEQARLCREVLDVVRSVVRSALHVIYIIKQQAGGRVKYIGARAVFVRVWIVLDVCVCEGVGCTCSTVLGTTGRAHGKIISGSGRTAR
jgi:hypothetical protein